MRSIVSNRRLKVKVCGMTCPKQVSEIVDLGVDAIGMILHADSPRQIDTKVAQEIRSEVPAFVSLVGVFVDADASIINQYSADIGLDLIQLHGFETNQFGASLRTPFIKAIRARTKQQVESDSMLFPDARALLLDPYVKGQHGGTGRQLDSGLWPSSASHKLILAGGLSADNVAKVCSQLTPFAVDLNSGIESEPGKKDMVKLLGALNALSR